MRTIVVGLLFWGILAGGLPSAWAGEVHLQAARGIGDFLVATATREDGAWSWRQYEGPGPGAHGEERHRPVSLYVGTAGTGWFLLNLGLATKKERYLDAAAGAGRYLLRTAHKTGKGGIAWRASQTRKGRRVPEGEGLGLYVGNAGIGLFLQHLHEATGEDAFRKGARKAFQRIRGEAKEESGGLCWGRKSLDLISGEAGIGVALLDMARRTGEGKYRTEARRVASWLVTQGQGTASSLRWRRHGWHDPNFSHGAAGIGFFLAGTGDPAHHRAARRAGTWVRSRARPCEDGCLLWSYYGGSPPEGRRDWVMNAWCHGAPGTVRLFLALAGGKDGEEALKVAQAGGRGILHALGMPAGEPRFLNPTLCCGGAGCLDALLELYRATGQKDWLEAAEAVGRRIQADLTKVGGHAVHASYDEKDRVAKKHPYVATGLMQGNAGIGYALLRLSLAALGRGDVPVPLPDHPR